MFPTHRVDDCHKLKSLKVGVIKVILTSEKYFQRRYEIFLFIMRRLFDFINEVSLPLTSIAERLRTVRERAREVGEGHWQQRKNAEDEMPTRSCP